ncbi:hypothetical protein [Actinomycetospora chiangmaiensis]|uniref:hypothetical protein n=1 Tax=Actinomycetospora chiangmaiensis TaxID=402650 RepID=UPI00037D3F8A|nr:hypothetical protein [Actinomycetospora chiangmaiensis]
MTTLSAAVDLPVTAHTVRDARTLVLDLADSWDTAACRVDLALLIDDLTDDVVSHAGGENALLLELTLHDRLLRVSLADGGAVRPAVADALVGRLPLLGALAERWGHEPYQGGRRVWFELDSDPSAPEDGVDLTPDTADRIRRLLGTDPDPTSPRVRRRIGRRVRAVWDALA